MVYDSKVVLLTDLDYGSTRVRAYDEQGAEASLEDAMDQLDEVRDVALLRSAKYQQALSAGLGLQRRRPSPSPHLEQQGPPQALSAMGRTVRHHRGAPTRRLQAQNHQR